MLPGAGIDNILYPMTAEIFYSENKQNDFGNMERTWIFDRVIKCSAVSAMADKTLNSELKSTSIFFQYNSDIAFRTADDIQRKKGGTYYPITEILLTNIKDAEGYAVWTEREDSNTQYEVQSFVPSYNAFHSVEFHRGYLTRSTKQHVVVH